MITESIALVIAGFVTPFIAQSLKKAIGWQRKAALLLALIVAVIISFISILVASIFDPSVSFTLLGTAGVFSLATIVYKLWK